MEQVKRAKVIAKHLPMSFGKIGKITYETESKKFILLKFDDGDTNLYHKEEIEILSEETKNNES